MKNLRKIIPIMLIMLFTISLCSCGYEPDSNYVPPEQPHLYYKDIDAEVVDIDKRHWYASTHWYEVNITVYSEEYDLEETFTIKGSGAFGCPKEWEYEEGDTVNVELYSWVLDSTGEVVKRKLNKIN